MPNIIRAVVSTAAASLIVAGFGAIAFAYADPHTLAAPTHNGMFRLGVVLVALGSFTFVGVAFTAKKKVAQPISPAAAERG